MKDTEPGWPLAVVIAIFITTMGVLAITSPMTTESFDEYGAPISEGARP